MLDFEYLITGCLNFLKDAEMLLAMATFLLA